jgi:hypothetical protein
VSGWAFANGLAIAVMGEPYRDTTCHLHTEGLDIELDETKVHGTISRVHVPIDIVVRLLERAGYRVDRAEDGDGDGGAGP